MRRALLILALSLPLSAATYYMRADGSAANKAAATSCSAASTAMNITTHNSQTFAAGDTITLCDSGGVFRDGTLTPPTSGTAGSPVTYTASGSPILSGANLLGSGSWTSDGVVTNVWNATISGRRAVFSGVTGTWAASKAAITAPLQYFTDGTTLSVYATANPATLYTMEASARNSVVSIASKNYITLNGLHLTNADQRGVSSSGTSDHTVVTNCTIDYIGYALTQSTPGGYGQGIMFYGTNARASYNTVSNINNSGIYFTAAATSGQADHNTVSNCWNGKTYSGGGIGTGIVSAGATGVQILNNTVSGCYHGIGDGDFGSGSSDTLIAFNVVYSFGTNGIDHEQGVAGHPVKIYHNTVIHNPYPGWAAGHGIVCQTSGDHADIRNNIVYGSASFTGTATNVHDIRFDAAYTDININNNLYFVAPGSTIYLGGTSGGSIATFSAWLTALGSSSFTGKDASSVNADPLFTNLATGDVSLRFGSSAVGTGVYIAGVSTMNPPNIGASQTIPVNAGNALMFSIP